MIDALILAGFAGWMLATVLYQLNRTPLSRIDWYGFIPNCRFFCPHPSMTDLRVYYATSAEVTDDRAALVWRPLPEQDLPRVLPFWNPDLRLRRSVGKLAAAFDDIRDTHPPAGAHYTVPYLRLLNLAVNADEGSAEPFVRFIMTEHRGRASADRLIVFESRTHAR